MNTFKKFLETGKIEDYLFYKQVTMKYGGLDGKQPRRNSNQEH